MSTRVYSASKRAMDILAALLGTAVYLLPWCVIAIVIKLQSPGPVIYRAQRVGQNGRVFTLYKFRSMRVDSGAIPATTLRGDPRIFPFGHFLRISKLDETPQLINILKGDMSVVGPRPEDQENSDRFYVGKYREILSVKPGLSSPASLYDYTHGELYTTEAQYVAEFLPRKLDVELYYVTHRSLWYDLKTVARTVVIILQTMAGKKEFAVPVEAELCRKAEQAAPESPEK